MTIRRRAKRKLDYNDAEKQFLLTGMTLHPAATRFGHPIHKPGLNLPEIRIAWERLGDELGDRWQSDEFARYRNRHGRPFASRVLGEGGKQNG